MNPLDPRRSCAGKRRYSDPRPAERVVARMRSQGLDPERYLEVYGCVFCAGWHLGHPIGLHDPSREAGR